MKDENYWDERRKVRKTKTAKIHELHFLMMRSSFGFRKVNRGEAPSLLPPRLFPECLFVSHLPLTFASYPNLTSTNTPYFSYPLRLIHFVYFVYKLEMKNDAKKW